MNPLKWTGAEQIALVLTACIGAALAVPFGYLVFAANTGAEGTIDFGLWLSYPVRNNAPQWGIYGASVGAAIYYVVQLTRAA